MTIRGSAAPIRLHAGDATVELRPSDGARLASFTVAGRELLVTGPGDPMDWGCYPMVPYAGRVRHGRFAFDGRSYELPLGRPPHAIHGIVFDRPWQVEDATTLSVELGPPWPFAGRVIQRVALEPGRLILALELHAAERMPAMLGWHPWFRRRLDLDGVGGGADTLSAPAELDLAAGAMYVRDAEGIPSGALVPPTPGPWDDCMTDLRAMPTIRWPGLLELELRADTAEWVIFTELPHAICVEPQTGPPDALNLRPVVVEPGRPLRATMEWRWRSLEAPHPG
jgi:aldose 1-epimerase